MELYFNELSLPKEQLSVDKLLEILEIRRFVRNYDITTCRICYEDNIKIMDFLYGCDIQDSRAKNLANGLAAFLRTPYENERLTAEKEDQYLSCDWRCFGQQCFGLALAHIFGSFALSYFESLWDQDFLTITSEISPCEVPNFCNFLHAENLRPKLVELQDVQLIVTDILPEDKELSLRDDHGKDILKKFGQKINRNEYVVGVINSVAFNGYGNSFIRSIKEDGVVEIMLTHTDEKFGLVVKTTGRNMRETEKIADVLREQYGGV